MSVICTKCGGTNVSCEAMINPNTKEFKNYTDESFSYGWCDDCDDGIALTDIEEIQNEIDTKFSEFVNENRKEPEIANCCIAWKDGESGYDVKIQLSADSNPDEEDDIFFYCDSLNDLKSLATFGVEDFIVTECYSFE